MLLLLVVLEVKFSLSNVIFFFFCVGAAVVSVRPQFRHRRCYCIPVLFADELLVVVASPASLAMMAIFFLSLVWILVALIVAAAVVVVRPPPVVPCYCC
ncbi:hypothetical protein BVRB_5g108000 [Beta vulgaris subsp. vulgaris]|nr:hypothetical protein BVRB_5g108000 [Beta vulgaris subsp. vulgaris]